MQAACDHMKSWFSSTPDDDWVSMGVFSDGSYGTPEGVMFSFPVTIKDGKWSIVQVLYCTVLHGYDTCPSSGPTLKSVPGQT